MLGTGSVFPGVKWELNSELNNTESQSNFFSIRPSPCLSLKFFSDNRFIWQENETEDQEVGSKDGIVDAWYEGINWKLGSAGKGFHLGVGLYVLFFA